MAKWRSSRRGRALNWLRSSKTQNLAQEMAPDARGDQGQLPFPDDEMRTERSAAKQMPLVSNRSLPQLKGPLLEKQSSDLAANDWSTVHVDSSGFLRPSESYEEMPFDEKQSFRTLRSETMASGYWDEVESKFDDESQRRSAFRESVVSQIMKNVEPAFSFTHLSRHEDQQSGMKIVSKEAIPSSLSASSSRKHFSTWSSSPSNPRKSWIDFDREQLHKERSPDNSLALTDSLSELSTVMEERKGSPHHSPASTVRELGQEMFRVGEEFGTFLKDELPEAVEDMKSDFISSYCCCRQDSY